MATDLDLEAILKTINARINRLAARAVDELGGECAAYVAELTARKREVMVAAGDPAAYDDGPVRAWLKEVPWRVHLPEGTALPQDATPQVVGVAHIPSGENVPPPG